ncbi:pentapeptide repeat-containing protein [Ketobacter alkanivorans]
MQCKFTNCVFRGTSFSGCRFVECEFLDCNFVKDNLGSGCSFSDSIDYGSKVINCTGYGVRKG